MTLCKEVLYRLQYFFDTIGPAVLTVQRKHYRYILVIPKRGPLIFLLVRCFLFLVAESHTNQIVPRSILANENMSYLIQHFTSFEMVR